MHPHHHHQNPTNPTQTTTHNLTIPNQPSQPSSNLTTVLQPSYPSVPPKTRFVAKTHIFMIEMIIINRCHWWTNPSMNRIHISPFIHRWCSYPWIKWYAHELWGVYQSIIFRINMCLCVPFLSLSRVINCHYFQIVFSFEKVCRATRW